ncbi:MAG TPA: NUDIX domain-containing protein [Deltaproteobacteria bacterium]|nr:NUDIX domain-containing protein [Deltaproteobacteria bacterium]
MKIAEQVHMLESCIENPSDGLPEEIFLFISRITPLVNVDLLIKNEQHQTLLTWRDDGYYPPSWHIPGGIIRYKETAFDRIKAVALNELGTEVTFKSEPVAINEVIHPLREVRGHFISLLYECSIAAPLDEGLRYKKGSPTAGHWAWHSKCPHNIIPVHEMYRNYIQPVPPRDKKIKGRQPLC